MVLDTLNFGQIYLHLYRYYPDLNVLINLIVSNYFSDHGISKKKDPKDASFSWFFTDWLKILNVGFAISCLFIVGKRLVWNLKKTLRICWHLFFILNHHLVLMYVVAFIHSRLLTFIFCLSHFLKTSQNCWFTSQEGFAYILSRKSFLIAKYWYTTKIKIWNKF